MPAQQRNRQTSNTRWTPDLWVYEDVSAMAGIAIKEMSKSREIKATIYDLIDTAIDNGHEVTYPTRQPWFGDIKVTKYTCYEYTRYQGWLKNKYGRWHRSSGITFKGKDEPHQMEVRKMEDEAWWNSIDEHGVPDWYETNGGDSDAEYWQ